MLNVVLAKITEVVVDKHLELQKHDSKDCHTFIRMYGTEL